MSYKFQYVYHEVNKDMDAFGNFNLKRSDDRMTFFVIPDFLSCVTLVDKRLITPFKIFL